MKTDFGRFTRQILTTSALLLTLGGTAYAATPWLHTSGNQIYDASGNAVTLRGTSLISNTAYANTSTINSRIDMMCDTSKGWYTRVVRYPITPGNNASTDYSNWIDPVVQHAVSKGLYIIIDLHYIANYGSGGTSASSLQSWWTTIAPHYANTPNVIFEIYNEPISPADWTSWKNYIQPVVNAVRGAAPNNLILLGNPSYSTTLNGAVSNPVTGANIAYVYHLYPNQGTPSAANLDPKFGTASNSIPIYLSEFGFEGGSNTDSVTKGTLSGWGNGFKTYMEGRKNLSWSCWVFDNSWLPVMFDSNWNLLGGDSYEGQWVHDWLQSDQNDRQPQAGGGSQTVANGTYKIINRLSGLALDAYNNGTGDGTVVDQWGYSGGNNQRWNVTWLGGGVYSIVNVNANKPLDAAGSGGSGTWTDLWTSNGGANQKWIITATSGGYYEVSPSYNSGLALDDYGASTSNYNTSTNFGRIDVWNWSGSTNQQWAFWAP